MERDELSLATATPAPKSSMNWVHPTPHNQTGNTMRCKTQTRAEKREAARRLREAMKLNHDLSRTVAKLNRIIWEARRLLR